MLTGTTSDSYRNLKLNAGVLIEDLEYTGAETLQEIKALIRAAIPTNKCLGATRGGSTFVSEAETRTIELDGQRVSFKGSTVKDSVTAQIETTLMEFTEDNLRRIFPTSEIEKNEETGMVKLRERIPINLETDYMKKLSLVTNRNDGGIIIFTLFNPMNTEGANISGEDKNEGEIPLTFVAYNDNFEDSEYAPYEMMMWTNNALETARTITF